MSKAAALLALDWGTTRLRAYLIDRESGILAERESDQGIMQVNNDGLAGGASGGAYERMFEALAREMSVPQELPVIACGMITSRQGWHEVAYVDCPADADGIAGCMVSRNTSGGRQVHFVPGLSTRSPAGVPDVMRGEETQLLGASVYVRATHFVLPGTHSKWAEVENGRISQFRTFMTGELFAALRQHTILGRMMTDAPFDKSAFIRGIDCANRGPGLLGALFSARTLPLFDKLPTTATADYLSGLLIGHEFREAAPQGDLALIGGDSLVERYRLAAGHLGISVEVAPSYAAALGMWTLARAANLIK